MFLAKPLKKFLLFRTVMNKNDNINVTIILCKLYTSFLHMLLLELRNCMMMSTFQLVQHMQLITKTTLYHKNQHGKDIATITELKVRGSYKIL